MQRNLEFQGSHQSPQLTSPSAQLSSARLTAPHLTCTSPPSTLHTPLTPLTHSHAHTLPRSHKHTLTHSHTHLPSPPLLSPPTPPSFQKAQLPLGAIQPQSCNQTPALPASNRACGWPRAGPLTGPSPSFVYKVVQGGETGRLIE